MKSCLTRRCLPAGIAAVLSTLSIVALFAAAPAYANVTYVADVPVDTVGLPFLYDTAFTPIAPGQPRPSNHQGMVYGQKEFSGRASVQRYDSQTGATAPFYALGKFIIIDSTSKIAAYYGTGFNGIDYAEQIYVFTVLGQIYRLDTATNYPITAPFLGTIVEVYGMTGNASTVALTALDASDNRIGATVDPVTGTVTQIFSLNGGTALGDFSTDTKYLNFGPDGKLYVLDYGNNRVVTLDPTQGYQAVSSFALQPGTTVANQQFGMDSAGDFFFGDGNGGGSMYDALGRFFQTFSLPAGSYTPGVSGNHYVATTPDNHLFVFDGTGEHLYAFTVIAPEASSLVLFALGPLALVGIPIWRRRAARRAKSPAA